MPPVRVARPPVGRIYSRCVFLRKRRTPEGMDILDPIDVPQEAAATALRTRPATRTGPPEAPRRRPGRCRDEGCPRSDGAGDGQRGSALGALHEATPRWARTSRKVSEK